MAELHEVDRCGQIGIWEGEIQYSPDEGGYYGIVYGPVDGEDIVTDSVFPTRRKAADALFDKMNSLRSGKE